MPRPIAQGSFAARRLRGRLEERVAAGELELPLLPDVAARVLDACQEDRCDAREIAGLIERDPSLAGHVLRVANSAAYAPNEPIVSLQQAVSRLGFGALCGIAVSVIVRGVIFDVDGHEERLARLWHHSASTGAWAKEIARLRRKNVEGAFLCGLLHDVGKPIVLQALAGVAELSGSLEIEDELCEAWLDEFHPAVGERLLASWGMPDWILESVAHHHAPEGAQHYADQTRTTCLADLLAHEADGLGRVTPEDVEKHPVLADLGLYRDELDELRARSERVRELAEVFA